MTREKWKEVTKADPCPICEKPDWCRRSPDGAKVACRRESRTESKTKRYQDGSEAYVHTLRDNKPQRKTSMTTQKPQSQKSVRCNNDQSAMINRDAGYRKLLSELSLSPYHRQDLKRRGLTDQQIDVGLYKTLPKAGRGAAVKKVALELGQDFEAVPGFFMSERGPNIAAPAGLLVPVRDIAGRIVALKVRVDKVSADDPRYLYLSSVNHGGPGPGSPSHIPAGVCGPVALVRITEGELKSDVATALSGVPTISFPGVASWRTVVPDLTELKTKTVLVAFDADADGNKHVAKALRDCCRELKAGGFDVKLERWSVDRGKGIDELLAAGETPEVLTGQEVIEAAGEIATAAGVAGCDGDEPQSDERKSQSTMLVELAAAAELWYASEQDIAYASMPVADHREHWPIRAKNFKRWLSRKFFEQYGRAPGSQALQDALTVLEGQAIFDGATHPVFVRVAATGDKLYLDLANETWQVVEIDADGWRVLDSDQITIRFRRAKAMSPLPTPMRGGDVCELKRFVNVDADSWPLMLGWLVACFRSTGPYPILALHGEQGSAKSTTARTLRSLIDPNAAPLRSEPKDPRDLMIAANNGWLVALDNLSCVSGWLSDALCRLATGGGFATRSMYENDEETIFDAMRPSILTGIEELANRSDLLDRSLILHLPRIPEAKRRTEAEHWRSFRDAHGRILGAILDAVSVAVRKLPDTHIDRLPRMADFALWATAAETGLGLRSGEFMEAYRGNRESAHEAALESSAVAKYIIKVAGNGNWDGQSSDLLAYIETLACESEKHSKTWPKDGKSLSGTLRRLSPNFRAIGIELEFGNKGRGTSKRRNVAIRKIQGACVPSDPNVLDPEKAMRNRDYGDAGETTVDAAGTQQSDDSGSVRARSGTHGDSGDAKSIPGTGREQFKI